MDNSKAGSSAPTPARPPLTQETIWIYRPSDIALDVTKVFPQECQHWKSTASDQGFLRIRPECKLGIVGLYGSLAVGNPPSPTDVDAWEASKPKDHWDYHSLFDFISVPAEGPAGGLDVVIFHSQDSFQERPLEVAHRIHLTKAESELFVQERHHHADLDELTEDQLLAWQWDRLCEALSEQFGSGDMRQQTWTVEGKVYDLSYPDA